MAKKKSKTSPIKPFSVGRDLYNDTKMEYKVYIEAALWAARAENIPLAEVKDYIRRMVSDYIVQELGFTPMEEVR